MMTGGKDAARREVRMALVLCVCVCATCRAVVARTHSNTCQDWGGVERGAHKTRVSRSNYHMLCTVYARSSVGLAVGLTVRWEGGCDVAWFLLRVGTLAYTTGPPRAARMSALIVPCRVNPSER